jgi:NitT/TauT family transport system ATP-binding protein
MTQNETRREETSSRLPVRDAAGLAGQRAGEMDVRGVCKAYGSDFLAKQVLEDCSFLLEKGKLTVLIGPSGCGKSTLINVLAGYEKADSGSVTLDGREIAGPGPDRLVVFQETALFPWMTTYENVSYGPRVRKEMDGEDLRAATMKLLEIVGLEDFRDKYPPQLSGGMQRRAELVRAMINHPRVMFMDEPFRGLDAMTRALMQEYYVRLFEEHRGTNLFVTSELEEGIFLADRLLILTNQPCRVKKIMEVNLPRPREFSIMTSPEYTAVKREALELLHEEAMKSFAAGAVNAADFLEAYSTLGDDQARPRAGRAQGSDHEHH